MRPALRDAFTALEARNIAGEARPPVVSGALPTTFVGSPDTVVDQVVTLPLHSFMDDVVLDRVISGVRSFFA